ncbi:HAL/PAL/TAL family ammonia-lyase [Streptomyces chartreusis]|uniref:HAL/PAL/TAL family ammonia-lyase n=1 Tax=Streptomyces chartreusis TaxID=1969 RepID=UPI00380F40BA
MYTRPVSAVHDDDDHSLRRTRVVVDGANLGIDDIVAVARKGADVELSGERELRDTLVSGRRHLRGAIDRGAPLYGITTGFGDSAHRRIPTDAARQLQENLVRFLGCGTGPTAPPDVVRAVMLVRANTLARGHSGVRTELVDQLLLLLNHAITPRIPEEGSVGASGDLVPLSYVAAVLSGEREADYQGLTRPAAQALAMAGMRPLVLELKEGLALVNGTAFMTGIAALAVADARRLALLADVTTALATEVLHGRSDPFSSFVHEVAKPHPGQIRSASRVRSLLRTSRLADPSACVGPDEGTGLQGDKALGYAELPRAVQDKYSLRCAPQFTGVLWDTLDWVERWLTVEINSSNDNPLIDPATGEVVAAGNFAGGHVALAMDALRTAVASVADLVDRQLALVVDEKFNAGLTPNLIPRREHGDPEHGLHHGFKGMQLACSSLTAEALALTMPLTAFSRSTECHNQDKVSMGTTAARRTRDVITLTEKAAAIHLLALCQAADLRGPDRLGGTRVLHERVRNHVPTVDRDRPMDTDIAHVLHLLYNGTLLEDLP